MTLNLKNITKWAEALESGDYPQGNGALARRDESTEQWEFCCLGVGCEVAIANGVEVRAREKHSPHDTVLRTYDDCDSYFPDSVREWFGFDLMDPVLDIEDPEYRESSEDGVITCSLANDNSDADFVQIAGMIRERYLS